MATTTTASMKVIRPVTGFRSMDDPTLEAQGNSVQKGMAASVLAFPTPSVDLTVLATAMSTFAADIAAATDGGKKAITAKNKQREVIILMLKQLAAYVEATCNNDMAIFTSSGFQAVSTVKTPAQEVAPATIKKVDQGITGTLLVLIAVLVGAKTYDLRSAPVTAGIPGTWTTVTLTSVKKTVPVTNLTPGTIYAFQVRALGTLGYTNWSDSVTRMAI